MEATTARHGLSECDRLLRVDHRYSPTRCQPDRWTCPGCGRAFVHVCDEAEGCFYAEVEEPGRVS